MIPKIVIANRVDEGEFLDAFGIIESECCGDGASVRTAENCRATDAEAMHEAGDHPGLRGYRVIERPGLVRVTEAEKIDRNNMKSGVRQHRCSRLPYIERCRVAVDQKYRLLRRIAELLVMDAGTVDVRESRIFRMRDQLGNIVPVNARHTRQHLYRYRGPDRSAKRQEKISFLHIKSARKILYQNDFRFHDFLFAVIEPDRDEIRVFVKHSYRSSVEKIFPDTRSRETVLRSCGPFCRKLPLRQVFNGLANRFQSTG